MTCTLLRGVCRELMKQRWKEGEKGSYHDQNLVSEGNDDDDTLLLLLRGTGWHQRPVMLASITSLPVGRETRRSEMHRNFPHPGLPYASLHIQNYHVVVLCTLSLNARASSPKITALLIALSIVSTVAQSAMIASNLYLVPTTAMFSYV